MPSKIKYNLNLQFMDKNIARKAITIVSLERRDRANISRDDIVNILVFKRKMIREESADKFINECLRDGLISKNGERFQINFNVAGVQIPIDFSFTEEDLFQEGGEEPSLLDRLLEIAVLSGKMTKKDALANMKNYLEGLKYVDNNVKLLTMLNDNFVNTKDIRKEIERNLKDIILRP
ncbi:MAG: DUF2240 family protein [Candidatus Thermoplasmatota archaeon]|nr:DUF2240 family protein [Candidatus Thermoplasmatota archaeon]MCL5790884.1 DUF2240 family protein [Candidatus Thermoplasmatota archaeon]